MAAPGERVKLEQEQVAVARNRSTVAISWKCRQIAVTSTELVLGKTDRWTSILRNAEPSVRRSSRGGGTAWIPVSIIIFKKVLSLSNLNTSKYYPYLIWISVSIILINFKHQ